MRLSLYLDDYETEKVFSYLRWIFLLVSVILFYSPFFSELLELEHRTFPILLAIGITYMISTQIAFIKLKPQNPYFHLLTKAGIIFDYIAVIWLLVLSGGVTSPLFSIFYLIIMHATIYWHTKGAFISSSSATIGYTIILLTEQHISALILTIFALNIAFIWIIGLFGSMLVLRERKHLKQKERYYELMITDYLTGLYNHRSFQEEMKNQKKEKEPFILLMSDIDHFKRINDQYGHIAGDEVLAEIGKLFKECSNQAGGEAFRYGGEEFTIILPTLSDSEMNVFFTNIYKKMNTLTFNRCMSNVTMSFGVVNSIHHQEGEDLLALADCLLYEAKKKGKNQAIFDTGLVYRNTYPAQPISSLI
ncbi:GGDEF domain-containing protein [Robertmurraya korlensis]|uniref:GGDEF domain-containing protein n=1 Tax=Robertmurraya korlensis TaxID=519977 RepID=UPI0008249B02|nr:diguanylate cyclase [Robertmurraya korlensis]